MQQEAPDPGKSVYFVGFWMSLDRTIEHYSIISKAKDRIAGLVGGVSLTQIPFGTSMPP
jgi:hypothetical protein